MSKSIWRSKTFWLNLLLGAVAIANGQSATNVVPADLLALVAAGLNITLRSLTHEPVHLL